MNNMRVEKMVNDFLGSYLCIKKIENEGGKENKKKGKNLKDVLFALIVRHKLKIK